MCLCGSRQEISFSGFKFLLHFVVSPHIQGTVFEMDFRGVHKVHATAVYMISKRTRHVESPLKTISSETVLQLLLLDCLVQDVICFLFLEDIVI